MTLSDVALWQCFQDKDLPVWGLVRADSSLFAVLLLLQHPHLERVMHVAGGLPDGSMKRWNMGRGF